MQLAVPVAPPAHTSTWRLAERPRGVPEAATGRRSRQRVQEARAAAVAVAASVLMSRLWRRASMAVCSRGRHGWVCGHRQHGPWHLRRSSGGRRAVVVRAAERLYEAQPFQHCAFGASVSGFDVRELLKDSSAVTQLRADVAKHRLLVFHDQVDLSGEEHLAISRLLGSLEHGLHNRHPRSPDARLLRISNDEQEGFVEVGTSGWHVDGFMLRSPFVAQTMHFLSATKGGDTLFVGLNELIAAQDAATQDLWRRLWFVSGVGDLSKGAGQLAIHPLVFRHPVTGDESMCFHLGQSYCVGWIEEKDEGEAVADDGPLASLLGGVFGEGSAADRAEAVLLDLLGAGAEGGASSSSGQRRPPRLALRPPRPLQESIRSAINRCRMVSSGKQFSSTISRLRRKREGLRTRSPTPASGDGGAGLTAESSSAPALLWKQEWATGDLAIIDNQAIAHIASPGTQMRRGPDDLRLFHRTTMADLGTPLLSARRGATSMLLTADAGEPTDAATRAGAAVNPQALRAVLEGFGSLSLPA